MLRSEGNRTVQSASEGATHCPMPVECLKLPTRVHRILRQAGCRPVDDVLAKWPDRILRINGVGHVLVREVGESLRRVVPNLVSALPPDTLKRMSVQVPYSADQNTFLNNAMAKWKAWAREDRAGGTASRKPMERSFDEKGSLECEHIEFLRMCMTGMTGGQIGQKKKCGSQAVYARKRRLVLRYVDPNRLQRLPQDLQHFVVKASENYLKRSKHTKGES